MRGFTNAKSAQDPHGMFASVEHLEFDEINYSTTTDIFEKLVEARGILRDGSNAGRAGFVVPKGQEAPVQWFGVLSIMDTSTLRIQNAKQATIFGLPIETLITIFRFAIEYRRDSRNASKRRPSEILSHVCHHFRQVMLDLPEAWAVIDFPLFWRMTDLLPIIAERRALAKNHPLYILVRDGDCEIWSGNVIDAFSRAFDDANIHQLAFHLNHFGMRMIPHQLTLTLSRPPRSLLLCRPQYQRVSPRFEPSQRKGGHFAIDHCIFYGNYIMEAIPSIELVDMTLRFQGVSDKAKFGWTSFTYRREHLKGGFSPAVSRDLLFLCCPRLRRINIDGSLVMERAFGNNTPFKPASSLKEIYLYQINDMESYWCLASQRPPQMPQLRKLGMNLFQLGRLVQFLSTNPTVEELSFGPEHHSVSTAEIAQILAG
ncbi:SubName: Full=Uncharacterized protein {ECO:0000313/EMBL:CCA71909.1} [Serendipita indica DSM 11827]|nr:SubName: Full=Uncharacterized protein {ECO:0000313/EMBL:CCA71909.1} [Serendipita indica DSM 11827]